MTQAESGQRAQLYGKHKYVGLTSDQGLLVGRRICLKPSLSEV